jgi:sec-independent protein translocase protein TatB
MFGIELPELVVIAVVALIVIGPEHLPKVARTMGHLWGRAQRYISSVKADMSRDAALDDLRKLQQTAQAEVGNIKAAMQEAGKEVSKQVSEIETEITASKYQLGQAIPPSELEAQVLPASEWVKSEMPKTPAPTTVATAQSDTTAANVVRHEIIEEHHAVLPVSAEKKNSVNS